MAKSKDGFTEAINFLEKKYGKSVFADIEDKEQPTSAAMSTGSVLIDEITGIGGFPLPGIVELYGTESSGKTTLALSVIAQAQAQGEVCGYIDSENALDFRYAKALGVEFSDARYDGKLFFAQPSAGEEALQIVDALIRTNKVRVIVIDSVASLCPQDELEGTMDQKHVALQARMMGQALRKMTAIANKNNVTLIFINQLRDKVGVMFGERTTTPGGRALKFYAKMRIYMASIKKVQDTNKNVVANTILVEVKKNKCAAPFKKCTVSIRFGEGIDKIAELIKIALENKIIKKTHNSYVYGDQKYLGYEALRTFFKEAEDELGRLKRQIQDLAANKDCGAIA